MKLQDYLRTKEVSFEVLPHRTTFDSQRMAQSVHVPGDEVAKTVLLRCDGDPPFAVAILPATKHVNLSKAERVLGVTEVVLANEREMHEHCPDCERGILPPFGSSYGMATIVDRSLAEHDEIVFEGDTHQESIRVKYLDFLKLEEPAVASFAD